MTILRLAAAALISWTLAGCGAAGATAPTRVPSPSPDLIGLGVVNATNLRVALVVNTSVIETLAPGGADTAIHLSALPPLPWIVELRTSSGRVLVTMTADSSDIQGPTAIGAPHSGKEAAVDLSCGQLYLWTGAFEPPWPAPPASAGSPGDCAP
jgi:hypothetical protein